MIIPIVRGLKLSRMFYIATSKNLCLYLIDISFEEQQMIKLQSKNIYNILTIVIIATATIINVNSWI